MKILNKLLIPFAIIHIRYIQWRYKRITIKHQYNRSNSNLAKLILLQAKEYYYERQFDSWGKFHPKFSYSGDELKRHHDFMEWLFPEKDFEEWDIVIWYNPRAVTYYRNEIYIMGGRTRHEIYIPKQIKEWKEQERAFE